jgi:hypothetical protein
MTFPKLARKRQMSRAVTAFVLFAVATSNALAPPPIEDANKDVASPRQLRYSTYHSGGYGSGSSYGKRGQNALIGALFGCALLFIAPFFLVMTEIQGVKVARLILRARASTLANVSSSIVDKELQGTMIHTTGPLSASDGGSAFVDKDVGVPFGDSSTSSALINASQLAFPVRANGDGKGPMVPSTPLRVERTVQVYQWKEKKRQDEYETRFLYDADWYEDDIDSSSFHVPGHANPRRRVVPLQSKTIDRPQPCIGAFSLPEEAMQCASWARPS